MIYDRIIKGKETGEDMGEMSESVTNIERRSDWEGNHVVIESIYIKLLSEKMRAPTIQEIADECDLSWRTVWRHCKELSIDDFKPSIKVHTGSVLLGLVKRASEGYAAEVKLFAQLIHDWKEKSGMDLSQTNINEIRVTIMQGKDGKEDSEASGDDGGA